MAADDPTKRQRVSSSVAAWLVLALTIVTAYAAWQIMPLEGRIDALERQNLATRDRLLAEIERLNVEIVALRGTPIGRQPASATSAAVAPPPSVGLSPAVEPSPVTAQAPSPVPSAPEPKLTAVDPTVFIDAHLLPGDAAIARAMLNSTPLQDIARQTQHSPAFVLARGAQIEKMVSTASGAPRELVRALQDYLRDHRP
jgi:hypothetical protein